MHLTYMWNLREHECVPGRKTSDAFKLEQPKKYNSTMSTPSYLCYKNKNL